MHLDRRTDLIIKLGFRQEALAQLKDYIDLLWASNQELNLISRKMSFEELIDNHIIDCLLPLSHFPQGLQDVADFGSGGGLPGVLYAIQYPNIRFELFEKSPKKQEFLQKCQKIAPNIRIQGEIPKDLSHVNLVTARAFKPVDVILQMSRPYYEGKGRYFLLKARREKIEEEVALARKKFPNLEVRLEPLHSPVLEVERHLVLIP